LCVSRRDVYDVHLDEIMMCDLVEIQ
jgi:hypothetical protein